MPSVDTAITLYPSGVHAASTTDCENRRPSTARGTGRDVSQMERVASWPPAASAAAGGAFGAARNKCGAARVATTAPEWPTREWGAPHSPPLSINGARWAPALASSALQAAMKAPSGAHAGRAAYVDDDAARPRHGAVTRAAGAHPSVDHRMRAPSSPVEATYLDTGSQATPFT